MPVRVWPRAPKNMKKFHFVYDKTKKSQNLRKILSKRYKNYSSLVSECIVVAGGDGFMLNTLKRYYRLKKPFYGINCGSYGFLMNSYQNKNLSLRIKKAKKITINPLQLNAKSKKKTKKIIAINEVSLFRQSRQTASLEIKINKKILLKKLIGDGILISTPAGSTAYNLSVHGPILSLNSGKLAITPISPFRPRRWKGKVISNNITFNVKNLDFIKRPIAAAADNIEVRDIKNLRVKVNKKIKIHLLYDRNKSLIKKIKKEQIRKK